MNQYNVQTRRFKKGEVLDSRYKWQAFTNFHEGFYSVGGFTKKEAAERLTDFLDKRFPSAEKP
jgi:hypothetical protein